jgi:predicted RNase H-like nuclease (RuvC/YqgF family)
MQKQLAQLEEEVEWLKSNISESKFKENTVSEEGRKQIMDVKEVLKEVKKLALESENNKLSIESLKGKLSEAVKGQR